MIHAEVVLKGDRGECLGGSLDLDALLGLDGLMESVAVTAPFHDTAGLLVDNLNLVVVDDILDVFLEERIGFEQLSDCVDSLGLDGIVLHELVFTDLALVGVRQMLELGELRGDVG